MRGGEKSRGKRRGENYVKELKRGQERRRRGKERSGEKFGIEEKEREDRTGQEWSGVNDA